MSAATRIDVVSVSASDIERVQAYLRMHSDTSLFLASNLTDHGHALSGAMNSGNFKCLLDGDRIRGVFCLTRRGNLLAECGGESQFAEAILNACRTETIPIAGVVGEWHVAEAIWKILIESRAITAVEHISRELLYRLNPDPSALPWRDPDVRCLEPQDFDAWEPINSAYMREEGLPIQGSSEEGRQAYNAAAGAGRWWGCFEQDEPIAIGALNAVHESIGQIGGVYTVPERRRLGLATRLMQSLIADSATTLGLRKLILFTGENNAGARRLYESLGFRRGGEFALMFGTPAESGPR